MLKKNPNPCSLSIRFTVSFMSNIYALWILTLGVSPVTMCFQSLLLWFDATVRLYHLSWTLGCLFALEYVSSHSSSLYKNSFTFNLETQLSTLHILLHSSVIIIIMYYKNKPIKICNFFQIILQIHKYKHCVNFLMIGKSPYRELFQEVTCRNIVAFLNPSSL